MSRTQDVHGMLAGNDLDAVMCVGISGTGFEIGQSGRSGAYAAAQADRQAWEARWLAAVGWFPIPVSFSSQFPQRNIVHWLSPSEIARRDALYHPGPGIPSDMVFRDHPIRDVRGYPVLPALWSRNWDYRSPSTWDYNRRPPAGSGARPEPNELGAYFVTGGGASRRRSPLIRVK